MAFEGIIDGWDTPERHGMNSLHVALGYLVCLHGFYDSALHCMV